MARLALAGALAVGACSHKPEPPRPDPIRLLTAGLPEWPTTSTPPVRNSPARASRSRTSTTRIAVRVVGSGDCLYDGNWRDLVSCLWGSAAPQAFRVVQCESGGDPNNTGPLTRYGRARGLFQIMNGSYDPETNVRQAWAKYVVNRWRQWVCKP